MTISTSPISPVVDSFVLTEADKKIDIRAIDLPGAGGAYHVYSYCVPRPYYDLGDTRHLIAQNIIAFQKGPIEDDLPNGITVEALLAICKHRLDCFQAGPYSSVYNERALVYIEQAMAALQERTRARINAGVEGKMEPDPQQQDLTDEDLDGLYDAVEADTFDSVSEVLSGMEITFPLKLDDTFTRNAILSNVAAQFDVDELLFPASFLEEFDRTEYPNARELAAKMSAMILAIDH